MCGIAQARCWKALEVGDEAERLYPMPYNVDFNYRPWEDTEAVTLESKVSETCKMAQFSRIGSCH